MQHAWAAVSTVSDSAEEGYAEGSVFTGSTVATEEGAQRTGMQRQEPAESKTTPQCGEHLKASFTERYFL